MVNLNVQLKSVKKAVFHLLANPSRNEERKE